MPMVSLVRSDACVLDHRRSLCCRRHAERGNDGDEVQRIPALASRPLLVSGSRARRLSEMDQDMSQLLQVLERGLGSAPVPAAFRA